jgi:hypothetical protein
VIDLSDVRPVADFKIELRDRKIEYLDGEGRHLARFPAWEYADRDLIHFIASDVPLGSVDRPFEDSDEGWSIVIIEHEGYVYILEGDDQGEEYPRRFRVSRDAYLRAWAELLHRFNPVLSLEELLANAGKEEDGGS